MKKNTKGLTIDNHQIDIVEDIIDKNDVSNDSLKLKKSCSRYSKHELKKIKIIRTIKE